MSLWKISCYLVFSKIRFASSFVNNQYRKNSVWDYEAVKMDMRFTCLDKIPYFSLCELWKEDGKKIVWGVRKLVRIPYC